MLQTADSNQIFTQMLTKYRQRRYFKEECIITLEKQLQKVGRDKSMQVAKICLVHLKIVLLKAILTPKPIL